jgi:hypothetical protein
MKILAVYVCSLYGSIQGRGGSYTSVKNRIEPSSGGFAELNLREIENNSRFSGR